jgi:hypothetical protein
MKLRNGILAAAAVLALTACATGDVKTWLAGSPTRSPPCDQPQCNYKLVVKSCDSTGIYPEYDEIYVKKGVHRIHWVIVTPGYTFAQADGIHFPGNPREFTDGTRVNPKEFSWKDTNDNPQGAPEKKFKYNVRILSGGNECNYDPSVVNE